MHTSRSTAEIAAPRETVWSALTEPALVKQWQYGSDLDTTWEVGSPIRFRTEWDGAVLEQWGEVLAVDPPSELRYSLFAPRPDLEDRPEHRFVMVYRLEEIGTGTRLTIVQEDPRPLAAGTGPDGGEDGGESPVLASLRTVAETEAAGGR